MSEDAIAVPALLGNLISQCLLAALLNKGVISRPEAQELIDQAILVLERTVAKTQVDPTAAQQAKKALEALWKGLQ